VSSSVGSSGREGEREGRREGGREGKTRAYYTFFFKTRCHLSSALQMIDRPGGME
jgi:hypothetical protein